MRIIYNGSREAPDSNAVAIPSNTQAGVKIRKFGRMGPMKALLIEQTSP
jgi:hypothetical protein